MKIKILAAVLLAAGITLLSSCTPSEKVEAPEADSFLKGFSTKAGTEELPLNDAQLFVLNMGLGWNLGNTLDAYNGQGGLNTETCWGQPKTTEDMIKGLADKGIKTIRIPVSWHNHFSDKNYTIDSAWMNRVKQIVDWAMKYEMYVILNCHHDDAYYSAEPIKYNDGFYPLKKDKTESEKFLARVWTQISNTFKNYDEKLIFETMNEPRLRAAGNGAHPCTSGNHEWYYDENCSTCREAAVTLKEYNQLAINTIRATGGNNATIRYISCPNLCASPDAAFHYIPGTQKTQIELLEDSLENHLIQSVHMYTPYDFAMGYPGDESFTKKHESNLLNYFNNLSYFISKGFPVIIGETGATDKNNLTERAKWYALFSGGAKSISATCCIWDNGNTNPGNEAYGFYDRRKKEFFYPLLAEVALKQTEKTTKTVKANIPEKPEQKPESE